jgi:hypothetical protein
MLINKLDQNVKKTMNIRVRSGVLMAVYGLILIYIFSLTDKTSDG